MADMLSVFYYLEDMGIYEFFLPFLLVFVIVFAILEKTFIFGSTGPKTDRKPKTNINVVVSFIVGLLFLNTDLVLMMNSYLSRMSFFVVLGVMFMLVVAMFSSGSQFNGFPMWAGVIISLIAVVWSLSSGPYGAGMPYWYFISDSLISILLVLAVLGGIVYLIAFAGRNAGTDTSTS